MGPQGTTFGGRVAGSDVLPDGAVAAEVYRVLMLSEALATHVDAGLWPARGDEYTPGVRERLELAEAVTDDERAWARARAGRDARAHGRRLRRGGPRPLPGRLDRPAAVADGVDPRDLAAAARRPAGPARACPALALPDGTQLTGPRGADATVLAGALAV